MHEDDARVLRGDFAHIFPPSLCVALKRTADAKNIPYASMVSNTIALTAMFSSTTWCKGLNGNLEPLIFHIRNIGPSGINKSGSFEYFIHIFHEVRGALVAFL